MIKILHCEYKQDFQIFLEFSDGEKGLFDLKEYLTTRSGPLLEPLQEEDYVRRCFIEAGALCWPNGLALSPARLHEPHILKQVA